MEVTSQHLKYNEEQAFISCIFYFIWVGIPSSLILPIKNKDGSGGKGEGGV